MLAYNVLSCVRAALRSVHGTGKIEAGISNYYLADEISGTYRGMMIAIPTIEWQVFHQMTIEQVCDTLKELAMKVRLEAFSSSPRKPKKKKPKPPYDPNHPHVSTARLLAQAQQKKSRAYSNSLLTLFYLINFHSSDAPELLPLRWLICYRYQNILTWEKTCFGGVPVPLACSFCS